MIRVLVYAIGITMSFLIQTSLWRVFSTVGITPNVLLVFVTSFALMRGNRTGIVMGFLAGLVVDFCFWDFLGFNALLYMFIGFVVGSFCDSFSPDRFFLAFIVITASDLAGGFASYMFLFLLRSRFDLWFYFTRVILPEAVYTLVFAVVLYPPLFFANERLEAAELLRVKKFV